MKKVYETAGAAVLLADGEDLFTESGEDIAPISNPNRTEWDHTPGKLA